MVPLPGLRNQGWSPREAQPEATVPDKPGLPLLAPPAGLLPPAPGLPFVTVAELKVAVDVPPMKMPTAGPPAPPPPAPLAKVGWPGVKIS